jgi:hypothetical protein
MSGYTAGSLPGATIATGELPLLRKPFDAATLLQRLNEVMQGPAYPSRRRHRAQAQGPGISITVSMT